jgi:UDP-glucose 4-epimerase
MSILVTGGMGFIGSHTVVQLLEQDKQIIILDNLSNSSMKALDRIEKITGIRPIFYKGDIRDRALLQDIFNENNIDAVMHFAGLKAVGESVQKPLTYYHNNVSGSIVLLEEMQRAGVFKLIFSSSATVYGHPTHVPIKESAPVGDTTNPYGTSKMMVEDILNDLTDSDPRFSIVVLRYFNPVGAHESGLIGEDPNDIPNNLLPYVSQVAIGRLEKLSVFGNDYNTKDGTGVRDYIHVVDLADGHVKALDSIESKQGCFTYNLGTGQGYSVLDIVETFETASQRKVTYKFAPRRDGDIATSYADPSLAQQELNWTCTKDLNQMMSDAWRWQLNNPDGYDSDDSDKS